MNGTGTRRRLTLALVLALCGSAQAQMDVLLTLDQSVYVVGEPVRADVRLVNHAPMPFGVGPGIDYRQNGLSFEILDNGRETLAPLHPGVPMIESLLLPPGESHAAAFELDEWYPLTRTGSYLVKATLRRDDRRYDSTVRSINVVPGLELQSATQFFAERAGAQRKLALVYYMRRQAEYLFLRLTDSPEERIWTTLDLGRLLRTTAPTLTISPDGEVTIIHRATQDMFLKTRVLSTSRGVELVGQERLLDPQSVNAERARQMIEDAENKKKPASSHWWWPFNGASADTKGK